MKKVATIAAVLCAIGTGGLGHLYFQRLEAEVSGGPKIGILVASKDIPLGAPLHQKMIGVRQVPQAFLEERHIRSSDLRKVEGTRVSAGLHAGDSVLWSDLAEFSDKNRVLSGLIDQGMRAVTVLGRGADFGGLLRPGDRVDVLLTIGSDNGGTGSTRTLLQNHLVLSVGQNIARVGDKKKRSGRGGAVTLSATVEGAQILAQARRRGELSLSLRNSEDITLVEGLPETSNSSLTAANDTPQATQSSARKIIQRTLKGRTDRVR